MLSGRLSGGRTPNTAVRNDGGHTMNTKKKDKAPHGLLRPPSRDWAIRFFCGQGHKHEEKIGRDKGQAQDAHLARRLPVRQEPSWCPREERWEVRAEAAKWVTVKEYGQQWLAVNRPHWRPITAEGYTQALEHHVYPTLRNVALTDVTREMVRSPLATKRAAGLKPNTLNNRIVTRLRAMFNRAMDDSRVAANPATRHMRHVHTATEAEPRRRTSWQMRNWRSCSRRPIKSIPNTRTFCTFWPGRGFAKGKLSGSNGATWISGADSLRSAATSSIGRVPSNAGRRSNALTESPSSISGPRRVAKPAGWTWAQSPPLASQPGGT